MIHTYDKTYKWYSVTVKSETSDGWSTESKKDFWLSGKPFQQITEFMEETKSVIASRKNKAIIIDGLKSDNTFCSLVGIYKETYHLLENTTTVITWDNSTLAAESVEYTARQKKDYNNHIETILYAIMVNGCKSCE